MPDDELGCVPLMRYGVTLFERTAAAIGHPITWAVGMTLEDKAAAIGQAYLDPIPEDDV